MFSSNNYNTENKWEKKDWLKNNQKKIFKLKKTNNNNNNNNNRMNKLMDKISKQIRLQQQKIVLQQYQKRNKFKLLNKLLKMLFMFKLLIGKKKLSKDQFF